jgi:hypothetical protein
MHCSLSHKSSDVTERNFIHSFICSLFTDAVYMSNLDYTTRHSRRTVFVRCTNLSVMRQQNRVMSLAGLGTKNDCAVEDQKQFSLPTVNNKLERKWTQAVVAKSKVLS